MSSEKKYENVIKGKLQAKLWWVRKLHGNLYQEGLPDLLLSRHSDGELILMELKGNNNEEKLVYLQIEVIELLKGPQTGNFLILCKMQTKICLVLGTPVGYFMVKPPIEPKGKLYAMTSDELLKELAAW